MLKSVALAVFCAGLVSAAPPAEKPGAGVLCFGTIIYFIEKVGSHCRAGQDPEFQGRIANYARKFDSYIVRNSGGDPTVLEKFKESQGLSSGDQAFFCDRDMAEIYDNMRAAEVEVLDYVVGELLARDGQPTFGDCF